jgi:hypothetical protein
MTYRVGSERPDGADLPLYLSGLFRGGARGLPNGPPPGDPDAVLQTALQWIAARPRYGVRSACVAEMSGAPRESVATL